ncbi:hypothetical protein [Desulfonatronum lacustre]|uniref:hypothetical protein n=1 Tax=Desulfonatronum lacustre TaxID=66849 RepID=UPI0009FF3D81|nr:hypothetical protein [Desulfonatronum lacustre]SMP47855.1 hypothetical protein SAMN06295888_104198 [Desulfonatronum zhilinae]
MRTTLDIEEDVLSVAKELARVQKVSVGRVLSGLARQALSNSLDHNRPEAPSSSSLYGFRPFPPRGHVVGNDQVNALRDQEGV